MVYQPALLFACSLMPMDMYTQTTHFKFCFGQTELTNISFKEFYYKIERTISNLFMSLERYKWNEYLLLVAVQEKTQPWKVEKRGKYWEEQILPIYWPWRHKSKSLFLTGKVFVQLLLIWTEIFRIKLVQTLTWGADSPDVLAANTEWTVPNWNRMKWFLFTLFQFSSHNFS